MTRIVGGGAQSFAIKSDGSLLAWGNNASGQLGDGSAPTDQHTPVTVGGLPRIVDLATGRAHTVALAANGAVLAWGDNNRGQLGDGTATRQPTPVAVSGLGAGSNVAAVFASGDHTHGLVASASVVPPGQQNPAGVTAVSAAPAAHAVVSGPRTTG